MKTTYILIAIIVIVLFSLFYRLYRYKYENFIDARVCELKVPDYREEKVYKLYFNKSTPLTKGGSVLFNENSHREFIEEFLKHLVYANPYFTNLNVYLQHTTDEDGYKTYYYLIKDIEYERLEALNTTTETPTTTAVPIVTDIRSRTFDEVIKGFCSLKLEQSANEDGEMVETTTATVDEDEVEAKKDCVYFAVQINFEISQDMLDKFIRFSLVREESNESYNVVVQNVVNLRDYNSISETFFKLLHSSKNYYFSRKLSKYTETVINRYNERDEPFPEGTIKLSMPNDDFNKRINVLNKELESNDFDSESLIEEMFSLKKLNLLDIKRDIKDKIFNSVCSGELYIPERLTNKKELIKYLGELDKKASNIHEATGLKDKELVENSRKYAVFHEKYKNQLEELLLNNFKLSDPDTEEKLKDNEEILKSLNNQITNIKKKRNKFKTAFDDFNMKKKVSLQNLADGTILNFSRIVENGKFVDKYMILVNDGCLKFNGVSLSIEYDWKYQMRNPQIHFNIEVLETKKDYLAKMNYIVVDEDRNKNFQLDEIPVVLISPFNLYGKVLVLKESRLFIENCTGRKEEQFRFHFLTDNKCSYT